MADVIPKSTAIIDYEITHEFPHIGKRTFLLTARRLWKPDNNSVSILLVFSDVTESQEKEPEGFYPALLGVAPQDDQPAQCGPSYR